MVNPLWVTRILLARALKEWVGFGEEVSKTGQDMRMMDLENLARLDDMENMEEPPFKKATIGAGPSRPIKTKRSEENPLFRRRIVLPISG